MCEIFLCSGTLCDAYIPTTWFYVEKQLPAFFVAKPSNIIIVYHWNDRNRLWNVKSSFGISAIDDTHRPTASLIMKKKRPMNSAEMNFRISLSVCVLTSINKTVSPLTFSPLLCIKFSSIYLNVTCSIYCSFSRGKKSLEK